jgi:hypothetical protein
MSTDNEAINSSRDLSLIARRWLSWPIIRHLRCLQFRRLRPLRNGEIVREGRFYGTPIVRYYWADFLEKHRSDIQGRGLEIGATETLQQYGGQALTQAEAIDVTAHSPEVTVVADLTRLKVARLAYVVYDRVKSNPDGESVEAAAQAYRESGADLIIGVGGGSGLDTAKAVRLLADSAVR